MCECHEKVCDCELKEQQYGTLDFYPAGFAMFGISLGYSCYFIGTFHFWHHFRRHSSTNGLRLNFEKLVQNCLGRLPIIDNEKMSLKKKGFMINHRLETHQ